MPWKIARKGNKFCVVKEDDGSTVHCHPSEEKAKAQMRALYASENKELPPEYADDNAVKDHDCDCDKNKSYNGEMAMPTYGAMSFGDIDSLREEAEMAIELDELCGSFPMIARNILYVPVMNNGEKVDSLSALASEFVDRVTEVFKGEKEHDETKETDESMLIWKENGQYHWITRYSNNFRDNDTPREIISSGSHLRFVDMVDKELAPYPELWLWHVKEWKIGVTNWLAYDDAGFALAAGVFDKDKGFVAEWLMKQKDIAVSHGMPEYTIKKSADDKTIIVEHETREISPLPRWAAANKMTDFVVLGPNETKEEDSMAIPKEKKEKAIKQWGVPAKLLDRLEALNSHTAKEATEAGIESKEVPTEPVVEAAPADTTPPVTEPANTATTTPVTEGTTATTAETVVVVEAAPAEVPPVVVEEPAPAVVEPTQAEAVASALAPITEQLNTLASQIALLSDRFKELDEVKETVDAMKSDTQKALNEIPSASIASLFGNRAVGNKEARVDGRGELAKSKPTENKEEKEVPQRTGIPLIDRMLAGGTADEQ